MGQTLMKCSAEEYKLEISQQASVPECRLIRAINGSKSGFWEWNLENQHVWYAPQFRDLLEFSQEEFPEVLESWGERFHPEDYQSFFDAANLHVETGAPLDLECRLLTKSGSYRWFNVTGKAYTETSKKNYISGSIQDIHEYKKSSEVIKEREAEMVQQQKMDAVGSLTSGVAHEFNNLLQAIRGYTIYAQETLNEDSQAFEDLSQVLSATQRAAQLTRQLLDFSRSEEIESQACHIDSVVDGLSKMIAPILPEHIQFEFELKAGEAKALVDPHHIEQALLNLCINSRDAMPDGGTIQLRSRIVTLSALAVEAFPDLSPGNYICLSVTDTGSGIPEDVQSRIFEPFYTTKEVGKGTGLGLSVTFGVIKKAGGYIDLYSQLDVGTTFNIYLPVSDESPLENLSPQIDILDLMAEGNKTVLIAEQDAWSRDVGKSMLEVAGYKVLIALNGEDAVQQIQTPLEKIDLVILGLMMPDISGREACYRIRKKNMELPICFSTGFDPESLTSKSLCNSEDVVLQKPFEELELLHAVQSLLHKSNQQERKLAPSN